MTKIFDQSSSNVINLPIQLFFLSYFIFILELSSSCVNMIKEVGGVINTRWCELMKFDSIEALNNESSC